MVSATVSSGDGLFAPLGGMLLMFAMVLARLRWGAAGGRLDRGEAGPPAGHLVAPPQELSPFAFHDQKLMDPAAGGRPGREGAGHGAPHLEPADAGEQRGRT